LAEATAARDVEWLAVVNGLEELVTTERRAHVASLEAERGKAAKAEAEAESAMGLVLAAAEDLERAKLRLEERGVGCRACQSRRSWAEATSEATAETSTEAPRTSSPFALTSAPASALVPVPPMDAQMPFVAEGGDGFDEGRFLAKVQATVAAAIEATVAKMRSESPSENTAGGPLTSGARSAELADGDMKAVTKQSRDSGDDDVGRVRDSDTGAHRVPSPLAARLCTERGPSGGAVMPDEVKSLVDRVDADEPRRAASSFWEGKAKVLHRDLCDQRSFRWRCSKLECWHVSDRLLISLKFKCSPRPKHIEVKRST
jgi:hypothetical protein